MDKQAKQKKSIEKLKQEWQNLDKTIKRIKVVNGNKKELHYCLEQWIQKNAEWNAAQNLSKLITFIAIAKNKLTEIEKLTKEVWFLQLTHTVVR